MDDPLSAMTVIDCYKLYSSDLEALAWRVSRAFCWFTMLYSQIWPVCGVAMSRHLLVRWCNWCLKVPEPQENEWKALGVQECPGRKC